MSMITPEDRHNMFNDLTTTGLAQMEIFDIRRRKQEQNNSIGGVSITSTAIESKMMELQHLRGDETLPEVGGLRIEANYRGFIRDDADVKEGDKISADSGTTEYEINFVQNLWTDHIEFFAQKVSR